MREEDIKSFEDAFFDALNLFNNQKWYEAHDAFEDIWNTLEGDERQIIQGILQVSVSQFHLSKGNLNGATILLGEEEEEKKPTISRNNEMMKLVKQKIQH